MDKVKCPICYTMFNKTKKRVGHALTISEADGDEPDRGFLEHPPLPLKFLLDVWQNNSLKRYLFGG